MRPKIGILSYVCVDGLSIAWWSCVQEYFKDCVFDLCVLDGAHSILCEAIEAYVNECQDRGVNIGPWRNETFCRE